MGFTGKYDFPGIKKNGARTLRAAILTIPWLAWLAKFGKLFDFLLEALSNWMANKGLIILNVGAIYVNGEIDQKLLDRAIDDGLKKVAKGGLTPQQMKEIDDEVIRAADRALPYNRKP